MIQLQNIGYSIEGTSLLREIALEVRPGEVVAVVGANGAGKTTLMRVLAGELRPDGGSAVFDGSPLGAIPVGELAQRRAILPQYSTLSFGFSALEVVLLGRTPHATGQEDDLGIAMQAMRAVGVDHLAARLYPTLSGGEQQRVHLARALTQIWEPSEQGHRYLFLDEPTASLDLAHQHQVLRVARECARAGIGVLTVLHDLNLASQHADRIAVLRKGVLAAEGSPDEVLTPEIIHRAFDISVMVTRHPCVACPLIVALPDGSDAPPSHGHSSSSTFSPHHGQIPQP